MSSPRYCLQENILSVNHQEGTERECFYVPAGTIISVVSGDPDSTFVEVEWEAKRAYMFNVDLRERAQPL